MDVSELLLAGGKIPRIPVPSSYVDLPLAQYIAKLAEFTHGYRAFANFVCVYFFTGAGDGGNTEDDANRSWWTENSPLEWQQWFNSIFESKKSESEQLDLLFRFCVGIASAGRDTIEDTINTFASGNESNESNETITLPRLPESLRSLIVAAKTLPFERVPTGEMMAALSGQDRATGGVPSHMTRGMNRKKNHEVERLSSAIGHLARGQGIKNALDLGAGQGYLSCALAYAYGLDVIGLDSDEIQTHGAQARSDTYLKHLATLSKRQQDSLRNGFFQPGKMYHVNKRLEFGDSFGDLVSLPETVSEETVVGGVGCKRPRRESKQEVNKVNIKEEEEEEEEEEEDTQNTITPKDNKDLEHTGSTSNDWLLCGLHTCGPLATIMLKHFIEGSASLVVNVGCCYQKLLPHNDGEIDPESHSRISQWVRDIASGESCADCSRSIKNDNETNTNNNSSNIEGYPVSRSFHGIGVRLTYEELMLAVQAVCRWDADLDSTMLNFRKHHWRAVLQVLLLERGLLPREYERGAFSTGKLKPNVFTKGYCHYARTAMGRLFAGANDFVNTTDETLKDSGERNRYFVEDSELEFLEKRFTPRGFGQIILCVTLRALCAEVFETLVVLDRWLLLVEESLAIDSPLEPLGPSSKSLLDMTQAEVGQLLQASGKWDAAVVPLFDMAESPRNLAIVAAKNPVHR